MRPAAGSASLVAAFAAPVTARTKGRSQMKRLAPQYLYSADELVDRAADILAEDAVLVHDSERRGRVFSSRVQALSGDATELLGGSP
jgi:hypothetical protein